MKFTGRDVTRLLALPVIFHATKTAIAPAYASLTKDPAFREAVQAAMLEYIDAAKIKGHSLIFDPVKGDFVKARFKKLHKHPGILFGVILNTLCSHLDFRICNFDANRVVAS